MKSEQSPTVMKTESQDKTEETLWIIDGISYRPVGEEGEIKKDDLAVWNLEVRNTGKPSQVWRICSVHYCGPIYGDDAYAKPLDDTSTRYNSSWVCRRVKGWTKVEVVN